MKLNIGQYSKHGHINQSSASKDLAYLVHQYISTFEGKNKANTQLPNCIPKERGFPGGSAGKKKNPPVTQETWVQSLGWEDFLEKGTATHSIILGLPWWLGW